MSGEALTLIGVIIAALIAFGGAILSAVSSRASASAAEVTALSGSTKQLRERLDEVERQLRGLRSYIADDHDDHRRNEWPIRPLPDELR